MKFLAEVGNWYRIHEIEPNLFWINEPGHVSFFIYKLKDHALFIDSGLGLSEQAADQLLKFLEIQTFDVVCTHAHCDHIGLNYRAQKIYISKHEWEKYETQGEAEQILHYYELLKSFKSWPPGFEVANRTEKWTPTDFVQGGSLIEIGGSQLTALGSQGHTIGSLMFLDSTAGHLFTGDLIYTGTMYLHLTDSDYESFKISLAHILNLQNQFPELRIWPCHNQVPLPKEYPSIVQEFISNYEDGASGIKASLEAPNVIFEAGVNLRSDQVSVTVKRGLHDRKSD